LVKCAVPSFLERDRPLGHCAPRNRLWGAFACDRKKVQSHQILQILGIGSFDVTFLPNNAVLSGNCYGKTKNKLYDHFSYI
jgi:hypothetical protein